MNYLPFEDICFKSKLDETEIKERLEAIIEPRKRIRLKGLFTSKTYCAYEGILQGNTFEICRTIYYRNSFLPIITGVIEKEVEGTTIHVKMRLPIAILIFMFIWLGGVFIGCIVGFIHFFTSSSFNSMLLIPFGMLAFGYLLFTGGFKMESIPSKKYFAKLFEAEMEG